jgi:DNA (cytosine-5)-methyltransferase 1
MNVLDLFCGAAGGWSLGLQRAGLHVAAACELDDWRRAVYGANFPGVHLYGDIQELSAQRIVCDLGYFPECLAGSPPCQDASAANTKGAGINGKQTGLFMEAIRLVREGRPRWVALENSPHLRTRGIDRVLAELEALGYACWPLVVGAHNVGAPHIRKRMWLVCRDTSVPARQDAGEIEWQTRSGPELDAAASGKRCNSGWQLAALVGAQGYRWNGGPERHLRLADGLPSRLARKCVAAYGDAIVPQIAELIGRAIMKVENDFGAVGE